MPEIKSKDSILYSRFLIGKTRQILFRARKKELGAYNVSPRQAHVLTCIYELGDKANLTRLSERTERNINTLSINMTKMEHAGLVKKIRDTPKSTKLRFELTETGFNIYQNVRKVKSAKTIMSSLSEEERQQLITLLEKIINTTQNNY
ncbi:MAG: MarR family winged helix-turn-helix transcriptional regulator [Dehalococcoidales bacterium]